jgi:hypothetical protein
MCIGGSVCWTRATYNVKGMQYKKLDPALTTLISADTNKPGQYTVFVHTDGNLDDSAGETLLNLGARPVGDERRLFTANLSRDDVDTLSDKEWVKYVRLSQQLHPGGPSEGNSIT